MKNAANCVNQCELQDTLIIDVSNAHGGSGSLPEPRPVEGRFLPLRDFATVHPVASRTVPRGSLRRAAVSESEVRGPRGFFPSPRYEARASGSWRSVSSPSAFRGPSPPSARGAARGSPSAASLPSFFRPQLGRDDPLNLSILLRGGKENNDDSLSKGD